MNRDKLLYGEIKFKPSFSFVFLKYVAIFVMTASQIATFITFESVIFADEIAEQTLSVVRLVRNLNSLTMPLLFLCMISNVFSLKEQTLKMLIFYGVSTVLFYVSEIWLVIYRLVPFVDYVLQHYVGFSFGEELLLVIVSYISNFNFFVDLFLCCAIYYFLYTKPKRIKTKKGLIIFRCFALVPILYLIVSFVFVGLLYSGVIVTNFYVVALIPRKKLVNYVIFALLLSFIVFREKLYNKFGPVGTPYEEYKNTNRYSFNFSLVACVVFVVVPCVDTLLGLIKGTGYFGIGNSLTIMLAIPFLLLHNFGQRPRRKLWSVLIAPYYVVNYYLIFAMYGSLCLAIIAMFGA